MSVSARHILQQGPVLAALGGVAGLALRQRFKGIDKTARELPGPLLEATVPPRPRDLVGDYLQVVGAEPAWYRDVLPAHLFPQWGFPLLARTLGDVPYPIARILNGGCRMEMRAPLPADEPLELTAQLMGIDETERRAVIHQRLTTGTASAPEALIADVYGVIPLRRSNGAGTESSKTDEKGKREKEKSRVDAEAREIGWVQLGPRAGLDFALLTGDFNPVHWLAPYARAAGFKRTILHGFATLGHAVEAIHRTLLAGDIRRLAVIDVKFTRPLVLPHKVGVFVRDETLYVGDATDGPAYLTGRFELRAHQHE